MIAGGGAHGPLNTTHNDPEGVAPQPCMCDPFRVEIYLGPITGATLTLAPRSHMYPLSWIRLKALLDCSNTLYSDLQLSATTFQSRLLKLGG
jgi:hypothetical protein